MDGYHKKPGIKKSSLIIGRQPIIEAIQSGRPIDKILFQRNVAGDSIGTIRQLARDNNIPIQQVPPEKLHALTKANHQGCVAIAGLVQYLDLQQVIDHVVGAGETPLFIMLDGVTDVRNIAMKSSAGALEKVHVCRVGSLMKAVDTLHLNGIKVYASEMTATRKVFELPYTEPCCAIMGSEDKGVFPGLLKICDDVFKIPMAGEFESLNVSVAAGIILYEAMKQRL
jgi:23S rRNA (guanosine2251-2'-O)-methyltransferase